MTEYDEELLDDVCERALEHWGRAAQTTMVMEELAELITAISHYDRDRVGPAQLAEEMAQVRICLRQLEMMMDADLPDGAGRDIRESAMEMAIEGLDRRLPDDDD